MTDFRSTIHRFGSGLLTAATLALVLDAGTTTSQAAAANQIVFNRDIRPILSENCFHCHGPDPGSRKAGLRLDTREGIFMTTKKDGPVVTPGQPDKSILWRRVVTADKDDLMPPPETHKEIKPAERELLKQWIVQGAPWQPHWSFLKPERGTVPQPKIPGRSAKTSPIRNPIDSFVAAKLAEKKLAMNPEADRRTLARRLSLDLTGLPPKPADVEAFVSDKSPNYYEKYVHALMDTPQWGEHRARYWLDAARYADTHGYHFDNYREMWPYRDWVIRAFNRNQPFDKFVVEQIAGDLLPNPTDDQQIATGFHRCNMTTNEGGTIEEENLAIYASDRVATTGWVFLGLTANCAACHDHKFDPITQKDYYSLAAFFRNTKQGGLDGNVKDSNPSIVVPQSDADLARWKALPGEIKTGKASIEERRKTAQPDFEQWLAKSKAEDFDSKVTGKGLVVYAPLNDGAGAEVGGVTTQPVKFKAEGAVTWKPEGKLGPAAVVKAGSTFNLGDVADFERDHAFSYGAWVNAPAGHNDAVLARMDQGNDYRGWDLFATDRNYAVHIVSKWPENALKVVTEGSPMKPGEWQHVFVTYDGSGKPAGLKIFIDGKAAKLKTEVDKLTATIRTTVPLRVGQRSKDQVLTDAMIQDVRVYDRHLEDSEVSDLAANSVPRALLAVAADKRSAPQKQSLVEYFLNNRDEPFQKATRDLATLEGEKETIRQRNPVTHVQIEKMDSMPMANVLARGQYDQKKDQVVANTPGFLPPLTAGAPTNRLGLAEWLVAPENPLMARVTVNRFWQELFGVGLVKTTEDFGIMGETPLNQELLDWLAVEFRESGWDVKHLFELMVMSSAYRQGPEASPDKLEKDPANRLMSRGPRFRMDAEMVRDYALSASGLLVPKIGGPSVKPYQPDGVWEPVAMPESNTKSYKQDSGDSLYRRSLYTFWKRAAPPASMDAFNAPSRETSCTRRERTDTPLQALVTLNDPQFVEAARHLAEESLTQSAGNTNRAVEIMSRRLLSRPLSATEQKVVNGTLAKLQTFYDGQPDEAKKLVTVGESKPSEKIPAPQLAAMTMLANQLLNLDEVLNK